MAVIFLIFYFNDFSSSTKEEGTIDADYLAAALLVESEKEIGSMDDMILALIFLLYIFG